MIKNLNKYHVILSIILYISYLLLISKNIIITVVISLLTLLLLIYLNREAFKGFKRKINDTLKNIISLGFNTAIIINVELLMASMKYGLSVGNNANQIQTTKFVATICGLLLIVIIIPVIEEIIFKYVLIGDETNDYRRIIISCLVFICLHTATEIVSLQWTVIFDMISYLAFFLITFLAYKKSDNILYPITIHILCNLVPVILQVTKF